MPTIRPAWPVTEECGKSGLVRGPVVQA